LSLDDCKKGGDIDLYITPKHIKQLDEELAKVTAYIASLKKFIK